MSRAPSFEQLVWQSSNTGSRCEASPATALRKSMTEYTRYNATGLARKLQSEKVVPAHKRSLYRSPSTGSFSAIAEIKELPHVELEHGCMSLPLSTPHAFEQKEDMPNLLVEVQGSNHGAEKVGLPIRFSRRAIAPVPPSEFQKYLSTQLGRDVTSVFYVVRAEGAAGRRASLTLERFEMEDEGNTAYPFVGGMKISVCVDGAEPSINLLKSKSNKSMGGCTLM